MSLAENKAIVLRHYDEVWNQGNLALIDELFAPDFKVGTDHWGPYEDFIRSGYACSNYKQPVGDKIHQHTYRPKSRISKQRLLILMHNLQVKH